MIEQRAVSDADGAVGVLGDVRRFAGSEQVLGSKLIAVQLSVLLQTQVILFDGALPSTTFLTCFSVLHHGAEAVHLLDVLSLLR